MWYHNGTAIEFDQTEWQSKKRICSSEGDGYCLIETTFTLFIERTDSKSGGNYTCASENIESANVYVQVIGRTYLIQTTSISLATFC